MRILQIIPYFPPFTGGVEYNAYYICRELVKMGHEITIVCYNHEEGYKEEKLEGMNVKRVPLKKQILNSPFSSNIERYIFDELKKNGYDLVHTHIPSPFTALIAAKAARKFKKPLFLTYHNDIGGLNILDKIATFVWNLTYGESILHECRRIFVTTPIYPKISLWLKWPGLKDKIRIVYNGVDMRIYNPLNSKHDKALEIKRKYRNKKIIFFVGSMGEYKRCKGIDYLIKSAVQIKKNNENFVIIIGGKGKLRDYYIDMAKKLGVYDVVDLVGYIRDEDMPYYYGASDLTVLPSINKWEGFGIILMESLATKKPVIGSKIGGIPFAVGNGGILVKPKDEKSLAEGILKIITNKKLADKYAEQGYNRVKKMFQWREIAKTQERYYKEVIIS